MFPIVKNQKCWLSVNRPRPQSIAAPMVAALCLRLARVGCPWSASNRVCGWRLQFAQLETWWINRRQCMPIGLAPGTLTEERLQLQPSSCGHSLLYLHLSSTGTSCVIFASFSSKTSFIVPYDTVPFNSHGLRRLTNFRGNDHCSCRLRPSLSFQSHQLLHFDLVGASFLPGGDTRRYMSSAYIL